MKNSRIGIKVTEEYRTIIERNASEVGLTISEYIRQCIVQCLNVEPEFEQSSTNTNGSSKGFDQIIVEKDTRISDLKEQILEKDTQMKSLLQQQDQSQQLLAMQQSSLNTLTEQNQLLIESSQQKKPSLWQRLIGQKI
jgi:hypothetical protein|tara:strand:+ start:174 stop:587 length:414 start_codon:yes stop_codon:yes gene_type:complete